MYICIYVYIYIYIYIYTYLRRHVELALRQAAGADVGAATALQVLHRDSTTTSSNVIPKKHLNFKQRNLEFHPSGNILFKRSRAFLKS